MSVESRLDDSEENGLTEREESNQADSQKEKLARYYSFDYGQLTTRYEVSQMSESLVAEEWDRNT